VRLIAKEQIYMARGRGLRGTVRFSWSAPE